MSWQQTPYTIPLIVAAVICAMTAAHLWASEWRLRRTPGAQTAALLLAGIAVWSLAYAMELASADLSSKLFWAKAEYLGTVTVPSAWLVFALRHTGRTKHLTRRFFCSINAIPTITLLLTFTNDSHGLIWSRVALDTAGPFAALVVAHGPWFWVHTIYWYSLVVASTALLVTMLVHSGSLYRWQARSMLFAALVPLLGNAIHVFGLDPLPGLDITPVSLVVTGLLVSWGMSGFRRGDIMAVSRGTVLQIMGDGVLVLDSQDRIVYMNPAAEQMLGEKASAIAGRPISQVWTEWRDAVEHCDGAETMREVPICVGDCLYTYDVRVSPQVDWSGHLVSQVVVIRDISDRKKVEDRREKHIADLAFLSNTAIELVELPADQDIYGFVAEKLRLLLGGPIVAVTSVGDRSNVLVARAVLGLGKHSRTTARLLNMELLGSAFAVGGDGDSMLRTGKLVDVVDGLFGLSFGKIPRPVCGALESLLRIGHLYSMGFVRQGELLGSVVIAMPKGGELHNREIVETFVNLVSVALQRKRAEEALRESEARFRRLADNAQDLIYRFELRPTPRFSYVSPAVRHLGYSPEECYSIPYLALRVVHPEDRHVIEQLVSGEVSPDPVAIRWVRRDGSVIWSELRNVPIRDEAGDVVAVEGIARDITERKQLEERLRRAERLETAGTVAGQVAHDFNNLLGPLTVYPDLVKLSMPDDHKVQEYCDSMLEAAFQMAAINEDMMALGRRAHFAQQPVDLNLLVQQAVERLASKSAARSIRVELSADLLPVLGSFAQLVRVVSNLLINALEATTSAGIVEVKTENVYPTSQFGSFNRIEPGEYVRLSVRDDGAGIADDVRDKIFDAFFSTKSKAHRWGCGLGLSVVQAIVADHQAFLDLESELGQGTTFNIYFPPCRVAARPDQSQKPGEGLSETILVVDDDRFQRDVVRELLRTLGYRADAVSSGEEAVAYVKERPVNLMILDMMMPPGIDGVETYRRVNTLRAGQRAILVSGFAESEAVGVVQGMGVGTFLRKPVTRERLARAVREALEG
jgi:PAS domain S-box-containing protein